MSNRRCQAECKERATKAIRFTLKNGVTFIAHFCQAHWDQCADLEVPDA